MRKIYSLIAVALCYGINVVAQSATATFEDIELNGNTFDMGASAGGKFSSGGFVFSNNYSVSQYGEYFDGFAISSSTSTEFDPSTNNYATEQFNSSVGNGAGNSTNYAVCYFSTYNSSGISIKSAEGKVFVPQSVELCNAAYTFNVIRFGNNICKKFTYDDSFTVIFEGYKNGESTGESVVVDLAKDGMLLYTWKTIDLSSLGEVDEIRFNMESTDVGTWGINTPTYFCVDDFTAELTDATSAKQVSAQQNEAKAVALLSADGKQLNTFAPGLNILKMSDGTIRKIYK